METSILSGMCRCCALEGTFKDLKCTYHWMGEQEVYGDMLRECFNIDLSAEDGIDGGICEVCITQLRNAANFKKQVLYTEDQFKKRLQNKFFKASLVKVELPADDGPDSDDNENNLSEDEAFSNIEYEVPIKKEELDEPKPKKRAAKATTSRAKKAKADVGETSKRKSSGTTLLINEPCKVSTKMKRIIRPTKEWCLINKSRGTATKKLHMPMSDYRIKMRGKDDNDETHMTNELQIFAPNKEDINKHLHNVNILIQYTNATLIKIYSPGFGYVCQFCPEVYKNPADLKSHSLLEHPSDVMTIKKSSGKSHTARDFVAKVDVTNLTCHICNEAMETLEDALQHLKIDHDRVIYTDIKNHIIPFKFDGTLKCVICGREFNNFKMLLNHMNVHYANYECPLCSHTFVTFMILRTHYRTHKHGDYHCKYCEKVFDTIAKRTYHEKSVHIIGHRRNKCPHCGEMFIEYDKRLNHMVEVHGAERQSFKCSACDAIYTSQKSLTVHIKHFHLMIRNHRCEFCEKSFTNKHDLTKHLLTHSGKKEYECKQCLKKYGRKSTLKEHLRIHSNDRRFKCEYCSQLFIQKCSLKSHINTRHRDQF